MTGCTLFVLMLVPMAAPLKQGDHLRKLTVGDVERSYLVHVPPIYDPQRPTPVVLCYHGAIMNGRAQVRFTGLSEKSDEAGFLAVYPNGTGPNDVTLFWNVGAFGDRRSDADHDDVAFTRALLDDLATAANVDPKRVFACGMSNGGMMCHRLGIELSDRIAAIAPVGGTLALRDTKAARPIPVLQIHGTEDEWVPWTEPTTQRLSGWSFRGVEPTIDYWVQHNHCVTPPVVETLPDKAADDGTTVERYIYAASPAGAEVVLVKILGGGHVWPGRDPRLPMLGRVTKDVAANDLIWEFFQRHPLP